MNYIRFEIDVRRGGDTSALTSRLRDLLHEHGIEPQRVVGVPQKRGGKISMDFEGEHADPRAAILAVHKEIETNANLIERIDWYRLAVFVDGKVDSFVQGDYRGWIRDVALEELRESRA